MEREPGERCQQEGRPVVQRRSQPGEAGCLGLRGHTKPPDFCALVKLYSKSLSRLQLGFLSLELTDSKNSKEKSVGVLFKDQKQTNKKTRILLRETALNILRKCLKHQRKQRIILE